MSAFVGSSHITFPFRLYWLHAAFILACQHWLLAGRFRIFRIQTDWYTAFDDILLLPCRLDLSTTACNSRYCPTCSAASLVLLWLGIVWMAECFKLYCHIAPIPLFNNQPFAWNIVQILLLIHLDAQFSNFARLQLGHYVGRCWHVPHPNVKFSIYKIPCCLCRHGRILSTEEL